MTTFPLQLLGRIRYTVVPLGSSAGCASALESSSSLRGHPPRLLLPSRGVLPGAPNKGNADGAEGIFDFAGRVWAPALRPDPP